MTLNSFVKMGLAGFLAASLIVLMLGPAIQLYAQEPIYGGRFKVGWLESLDNFRMGESMAWSLLGNAILSSVYEELAFMGRYPNYDEFVPMLAERWEYNEDRTVWTFYLSRDAKWHDGEPVTAEDVAFTAKYLIRIPVWNGTETDPAEVEIIDDYTIRFVMKQPISVVVPFWWVPILPEHIWSEYKDDLLAYDNKELIGSGPFKLKDWSAGEYILLEANTEYHLGRPYVDELLFRSFASEDAIILALLRGDIDMIVPYYVTPSMARQILEANDPNVAVREDTGDSFYWLSFNMALEDEVGDLLRNVEFRKAISMLIDRDKIVDVAFMGYAEAVDSPVYRDSPYYNPDIKGVDYDPAEALQMLEDLGLTDVDGDGILELPNGEDLTLKMLIIGTNPIHVNIATAIEEDLGRYLKLEVDAVDEGAYWSFLGQGPAGHGYHLVLFYQAIGPDITFALEPFVTGGWANVGGYSNPTYDDLFNRFVSEPDREARQELAKQMQAILDEDLPALFLVNPKALTPYRTDKFTGFVWGIGGGWTWFSPWTFREVRLKEAPETPQEMDEAMDMTQVILIAGVAIVIAAALLVILRRLRR